jgi:hypothetical protein
LIVSAWNFAPASSTAISCALSSPAAFAFQRAFNASAFVWSSRWSVYRMPPASDPRSNSALPNSSAASARPMPLRAAPMGDSPAMPS